MNPSSATASPTASSAQACGGVFRAGLHVAASARDPAPAAAAPSAAAPMTTSDALADRLTEYRDQNRARDRLLRGPRHPPHASMATAPVETVFADIAAALEAAVAPGSVGL